MAKKPHIPLVPLKGTVVFPNVVMHLDIGRKVSIDAVEKAMAGDRRVIFVAQRDTSVKVPKQEELFTTGVVGYIKQMLKLPNGTFRILVEGLYRAETSAMTKHDDYYIADVDKLSEVKPESELKEDAYIRSISDGFKRYVDLSPKLSKETYQDIMDIDDLSHVSDVVSSYLNIKVSQKQLLIDLIDLEERAKVLIQMLSNEQELLKLEKQINQKVKKTIEQSQKEFYLREQVKVIQKELGDKDGKQKDVSDLLKKIEASDMTDRIKQLAKSELDRFERIPQTSAESGIIRNYLDWLIQLPWQEMTPDMLDIHKAEKVLDQDHFGLEKIKARILEFIAVQQLTHDLSGPILCLVGPPGVGKTSLAQSIARAMGRRFTRVSLGGVKDESEIRGHRRTYVGAMPGRMMQAMKKVGTVNPVILLDEIDKMANDFRGDPASAMLEVLDPEQNHQFSDHFIEEPYDLSQVLFLATANQRDGIPAPLLDRMEVIQLSGYTEIEKQFIAKNYLVPKQVKKHGLDGNHLQIRKDAILELVRRYTREAGVRQLERQIASLVRKAARQHLDAPETRIVMTKNKLVDFLGHPPYRYGERESEDLIGTATGLAYTAFGGDILSIEVSVVPGKGKLQLTGKLGDVMQESAQAAMSYVRSRQDVLELEPDFYEKNDVHIHVPEGATPKDGPSAGITMATALISALTKRPIKKEVGMTGEITLRGRVLPIGGLKEKSLSAHRSGITTILFPKDNEKDLEDIPQSVKNHMTFIPVEHMDDVLKYALVEVK
ncbi:ATP-dependent Lon protease [Halolactibacillus halophilus]|uniref:Lon protease n=1 Tax=Halolactibacillus halophilus TaxID=306540 RepID=A0A1I5L1S8_9BACI|nr:endopeptidase La [Halolactibacillus halophilus]GEM00609.1 Lon protease [Halolactibacillus halophilus]SFO91225.1 ATP-dependent Lon protease [Halolactibacillus halophilus]